MELKVIVLQQLVQHLRIKIIPIQDPKLTLEVLYIHQHIVRSRLINRKLVLIHTKLLHQLHKRLYGKAVMLHRHAEFFLSPGAVNIAVFEKLILVCDLACITQKLLALRGQYRSMAAALEQLYSNLFFQLLDCS